MFSIQWCHNKQGGVSNDQRLDYSTVCSGANQRKYQSSATLTFVSGSHRRPVDSPHKGPVMRKMFPFDDVIMSAWHNMNFILSTFTFCQSLIYVILIKHGFQRMAGNIDCQIGIWKEWIRVFALQWNQLKILHAALDLPGEIFRIPFNCIRSALQHISGGGFAK